MFSEKTSTRIKAHPELEKALAHEIKTAAPDQPVILTVHEMKRLARKAAELMMLSSQMQGGGVQPELPTEPLTGIYDPHGVGSMLFAVLAVATHLDRDYIREKTLEGQQAAAARGNHGGGPKVIDEDDVLFARTLGDKGTPTPDIVKKLTIKTGKNAGQHPSVASPACLQHPQADNGQRLVERLGRLAADRVRRGGGGTGWHRLGGLGADRVRGDSGGAGRHRLGRLAADRVPRNGGGPGRGIDGVGERGACGSEHDGQTGDDHGGFSCVRVQGSSLSVGVNYPLPGG
ncbi:recombinase family protein [Amycolatopsis acidiphila]|nr:recombinase family protein [Amycolatopsis acidiphila]GHG99723.1 hypothetical protein GCM10017788_80300 [Amycolatopsis acidiphila]